MNDYELVLKEKGISERKLHERMIDPRDQMQFEKEYNVYLANSIIHGLGMFTTESVRNGDFICSVRRDGYRTPAGRYINHSVNPNCKFTQIDNYDIDLHAISDIKQDEELTVCYRQTSKVAEDSANADQYDRIFKK